MNVEKTKVSIIVPVYNVEKYLERCVDSLLNQSIKDIEIIIVDDESPDNCPAMCDEFAKKDQRIKVVHKKNGGLGMARNSGLDIAQGEYVGFIDSDDYADPNMFEILYNTAKKYSLDACFCSFNYQTIDGKKYIRHEVDRFNLFSGREEVDNFLLDMVAPLPSFPHDVKFATSSCKAIYSLDLIHKYHIRFPSERITSPEDLYFNIDFLHRSYNIAIIPDGLYFYCENLNSITHTYDENKFESLANSAIALKEYLHNIFPQKEYMLHYQRALFLNLRGVLEGITLNPDKDFKNKCKSIKSRCLHNAYLPLFVDYPYRKLGTFRAILYLLEKYHCSPLLVLFFRIKNMMNRKNFG